MQWLMTQKTIVLYTIFTDVSTGDYYYYYVVNGNEELDAFNE